MTEVERRIVVGNQRTPKTSNSQFLSYYNWSNVKSPRARYEDIWGVGYRYSCTFSQTRLYRLVIAQLQAPTAVLRGEACIVRNIPPDCRKNSCEIV